MNNPARTHQKKGHIIILSLLFVSSMLTAFTSLVMAEDATNKPSNTTSSQKTEKNQKPEDETPRHHKLVIQVSTDDLRVQQIALNNAINLQKHYGMDNIDIEIVAYGPGLRMLTSTHTLAPRIKSLTFQEIQFSACGNTLHSIEEKTGFAPKLIEGVKIVPAGVAHIIELQEQGYSYVRP